MKPAAGQLGIARTWRSVQRGTAVACPSVAPAGEHSASHAAGRPRFRSCRSRAVEKPCYQGTGTARTRRLRDPRSGLSSAALGPASQRCPVADLGAPRRPPLPAAAARRSTEIFLATLRASISATSTPRPVEYQQQAFPDAAASSVGVSGNDCPARHSYNEAFNLQVTTADQR